MTSDGKSSREVGLKCAIQAINDLRGQAWRERLPPSSQKGLDQRIDAYRLHVALAYGEASRKDNQVRISFPVDGPSRATPPTEGRPLRRAAGASGWPENSR